MNEDVLRWLCTALLKATGGKPVDLTDDEWQAPFNVSLEAVDDGFRVHVTPADEAGAT